MKHYTWDLSPLLSSDDDPKTKSKRKIIEEKNYQFAEKWKNRQDYLADPKILKEALDEYEKIQREYAAWGDEAFYFHLRFEQEQNNPAIKAKLRNIEEFATKVQNDLRFFELNISKIDPQNRQKFLSFAELAPYHHFLERLFEAADHLLSDKEERILSLKEPLTYSNWVHMTAGFLSAEEREVLTDSGQKEVKNFSEILSLMRSKNKKVRDKAAEAFNQIQEKYSAVAETELNSVLLNKKIDDELRHFGKPQAARLLSDDIEEKIVETMLQTVTDRFDIPHRYYKLKAALLGLKKLQYHERTVEYGSIDRKIPFSEALDLTQKAFGSLDLEFGQILQNFVDSHLIDAFPKKGKRGGAFCSGNLITEPTYILLNYNNTLTDVTTLAHEMGHAINSELMKKTQNSLNFGTSLAVAEVASTFMEDFVLEEFLTGADDELKLTIIMEKLDSDISTIFRQVACVNFEKELHQQFRQKNYLSKEEIGQIFSHHMASYMGNFVEQSKGSENWWIYWNHIRVYFYNYSYANGLLISKSLQNLVKSDKKNIAKVKQFLSAGLNESPKNIFNSIGLNITNKSFWENGLDEIENLLIQAEKLAKKLKKI